MTNPPMSYQVLARKWRPQTFDDVSGQAHVTTPLRNAIRTGRVPHAILLSGPRGVGKTTLARILARCLNCDKGPTITPCGECDPCREISAGISTDVQEIDAASRTSVDDVRELIAAIRYAAAPGKHRIFVVDEVHMLSAAAFNALLKTLEEPPARSLFVFATTNPEKIPFTVVSRCQRYDLRRIRTAEIVERLSEITREEKIAISSKSLLAIAREADGSMRDAQTLLDQVIAYAGSEIGDAAVLDVLDLVDRRVLLRIATACIAADAAAALAACREAGLAGLDAKRLSETLLQLLRDLVVVTIAPDQPELIEASVEEIAELRALAERTDATRLRRMFRALVKEQEDLAWAPQPFAVLELAVVRLATMPEGDDVARLLARLDALEKRLSGGDAEGGAPPAASSESAPGPAKPRAGPTRRSEAAPAEDAQAAPPEADAPFGSVLDRLRAFARAGQPGIFAALEGAELLERSAERVRIRVPEAFAARRLRERQEAVDALAASFFGRATRVVIEDAPGAATAAIPAAQSDAARQRRQEALNDPAVGRALEILGADIVEIRPLGGNR
ncbi:MAG TPA: DNA polymerase III subunit gamma/tau [Myxococcota bacterium]|nr:DNA polymerase III subunit gamma/tau [Myxococcota bacterium]